MAFGDGCAVFRTWPSHLSRRGRDTMRPLLLAALFAGLFACRKTPVTSSGSSEKPAPERTSMVERLPASEDRVMYRPGTVILVGEIHGTEEMPDFFTALVGDAAATGVPLIIGVEMKVSEQANLDAFMRDPSPASVPAGDHWREPFPDGRSSAAMLRLLRRARELANATGRVRVVAIDALSGTKRDLGMAKTVAHEAKAHPESLVLVLAGNLHTHLTRGVDFDDFKDPTYEPMGYVLTTRGLNVMGIRIGYEKGTFWGCTDEGATCGPQPTSDAEPLPTGETSRLHPLHQIDEVGYTYGVSVGVVHASPPAIPQGVQ